MNAQEAVDFIFRNAPAYAKAKAQRVYIEEFRKSKKALLMKEAMTKFEAANAQEREAYANEEYQALIKGLQEAVEVEEKLKWGLEAARISVEIWRSQEATNRMQIRATE